MKKTYFSESPFVGKSIIDHRPGRNGRVGELPFATLCATAKWHHATGTVAGRRGAFFKQIKVSWMLKQIDKSETCYTLLHMIQLN